MTVRTGSLLYEHQDAESTGSIPAYHGLCEENEACLSVCSTCPSTQVTAQAVSAPATPAVAAPAVRARAKAAILGGLVADAATMPLHW